MKKSLLTSFAIATMLLLCFDASAKSKKKAAEENIETAPAPAAKTYKGEGLVIAVTAPELSNGSKDDSWIPQYFQDSITGKFARFSKMTVVDRKNESMIKIEQELSESGFYSEVSIVQIGQMTNAQLVTVGNIQKISDSYEVNFRVNDATTNEIKASASSRYSSLDMQSGKAVNETVQALLEGLGITLSTSEKAELAKVDDGKNSSTRSLAVGAAAEKDGNTIDALAAYLAAENDNATSKEAQDGVDNIFGNKPLSAMSLKQQLNYQKEQAERWRKIFIDLDAYLDKNLQILVYDFSQTKVNLNAAKNTVEVTVSPGVKIVPDKNALLLTQKIMKEWENFADNRKQNPWVDNVAEEDWISISPRRILEKGMSLSALPEEKQNEIVKARNLAANNSAGNEWGLWENGKPLWYGVLSRQVSAHIGFYDDDGFSLGETKNGMLLYYPICILDNLDKSPAHYFKATDYQDMKISLSMDMLPDDGDITWKISNADFMGKKKEGDPMFYDTNSKIFKTAKDQRDLLTRLIRHDNEEVAPFTGRIMSIDEYNEWLKNQ